MELFGLDYGCTWGYVYEIGLMQFLKFLLCSSIFFTLFFSPFFLGDVLFQMAEVHRQIQNQLEEMVSNLVSVEIPLCRGWPQFIHLDAKYICY